MAVLVGHMRWGNVNKKIKLASLHPGWLLNGHSSSSWSVSWRGPAREHRLASCILLNRYRQLFAVHSHRHRCRVLMAVTRIARLTLFSGPSCSLCEVCTVQRIEMSSDERHRPDRKSRTSQSEETGEHSARICSMFKTHLRWCPAGLRFGSHQHPGKRTGKVEEEICLLDTCLASRWVGDSQGSLGCLPSTRGVGATGSQIPPRETNRLIDGPNDVFIVDPTPSIYQWHSCLYDRASDVALGEEKNALLLPGTQDVRLCFNCGSPDHAVSSCPIPIDRRLVSLSRQFFNFLHPDSDKPEFTRFYEAEGWKQQRLEWLESFEPGVIRGPLLRDALGLQKGDSGSTVEWLRNMAYWGYPPGWVGRRDPTEVVSHRILGDEVEDQVATAEWNSFTIFEGVDSNENVDLRIFGLQGPSPVAESFTSGDKERTRWATYPDTYFSSMALSIYNGLALDRMGSPPSAVSVTFTPERKALWERILYGGLNTSPISPVPPWRMPNAFGALSYLGLELGGVIPPPPPTTPPPLPPTPSSPSSLKYDGTIGNVNDGSVLDMDMSDDSE